MNLKRLFFTFLFVFLLTACNEPTEQTAAQQWPAVEVRTERVELAPVAMQTELVGTLQALEHARISARVSGQVVKLPVHAGSKVKTGDLLARLSAAEMEAQMHQAETRLAQVERNLAREEKLLEDEASTAERVRTLREQQQISAAAYHETRARLAYAEVRAPFSATVTRTLVEVGDLATPGQPLLQLENSRVVEVQIQVPESLVGGLQLGEPLQVEVPALKLQLEALIREISPTVDPITRSSQVKLTLPENVKLQSGQFARVALPDRSAKTLLIDAVAVRRNGQMEQVYVDEGGRAVLRLVRTGAAYGDQVEILAGLNAKDMVIVGAAARLHEGQPLIIANPEHAK